MEIVVRTENELNFKSGVELYNNGNYNEAINSFVKIINNGEHSGSLYFNLGNSYYKLNDTPNSIYYFEKALKFDLGARGLRSICESVMLDAMYEIPSQKSKKELVISSSYVNKKLNKLVLNKLKVA